MSINEVMLSIINIKKLIFTKSEHNINYMLNLYIDNMQYIIYI